MPVSRKTGMLVKLACSSVFAVALSLPVQALDIGGRGPGVSVDSRDGGLGVGVSVGGSRGVNAGAGVGTSKGLGVGAGASVGGRNGVNAGLGASVGGANAVRAGVGLGVGSGISAGVGIGVGTRPGTPGTPGNPGVNPSLPGVVANMPASEIRMLRKRCIDILGNPGAYDAQLAQLCRMLQVASR